MRLVQAACETANGPNAHNLLVLAAAYAEAGRFGEALDAGRQAADYAAAIGDQRLGDIIRHHLELYEMGQAYHELP